MNKKPQNHVTCGAALEWIHLLLDKELPPAEHQKLLAHLQSCSNCNTAYRQLGMIESAHLELDRTLETVPGGYFEELPERVLARLAQKEERAPRPFSLPKPKLPEWRMPGWLRPVMWGRGKYALAATAAVVLLTVMVTRQLRRDVSSEAMQPQALPRIVLSPAEEPAAAPPAPTQQQPETRAVALPAPPAAEALQKQITRADDEALKAVQGYDQPAQAAMPPVQETKGELMSEALKDTGTAPDHPFFESDKLAKESALSQQSAAGAAAKSATESYTPGRRAHMAMKTGAAPPETENSRFAQANTQVQNAVSEQNRRHLWREFLKSNPDSAQYLFALAQIGRSFAAEIDSNSSTALLREALQFYDSEENALIANWGREFFVRERTRVADLLQWKKAR